MKRVLVMTAALGFAALSQASFTVATFADPSENASQSLFLWDQVANTLTGGWKNPGMTVQTPGLIGGGKVDNAQMEFDSVTLTPIIPGTLYQMGAGRIRFHQGDIANPFFEITFESGLFQSPVAVGGSNLIGNNVKFSGPNVPKGLSEEQFSFSLTNEVKNGSVVGFTSAFTSSAVPEPATIVALGAGLAVVARRRRNKS